MGQAKNRGTFEQRQLSALTGKKAEKQLRQAQRKLTQLENRLPPHKPNDKYAQFAAHRDAVILAMAIRARMHGPILVDTDDKDSAP